MESKQVTEGFTISGQLNIADVTALHAAGIRTLICNRPDQEVSAQPAHADIAARAAELGMTVYFLPVVYDFINSTDVNAFAALLAASPQPVHAWCRSGLRSIALWCLAQVKQGADSTAIAAQAHALGFDFKNFTTRFASVIAEITDSFAAYPVAGQCQMLIVGGGTSGISLAASLLHRAKNHAYRTLRTALLPARFHAGWRRHIHTGADRTHYGAASAQGCTVD